jgi:hypothetical protein
MAFETRTTYLLLASGWSVHGLWGTDLREEVAAVNDAVARQIETRFLFAMVASRPAGSYRLPFRYPCIRLIRLVQEACEVIAEAENGLAAIQAAEALLPDLVFLDISMPVCGRPIAATK